MTTPLTLLAAVLALLAVASLAAAGLALRGGGALQEARGRVTDHAPVEKDVTVGGRSASRKKVPMTRVEVAYEAAGQPRALYLDRAEALATRDFPIGAELPVFYEQARPDEARLERGGGAALPVVLAVASVLLFLGSLLLFFLARRA